VRYFWFAFLMSWREWFARLGVGAGYVSIALIFSWPLAANLGTRLTGDPGGDTGVYVWNQWVFRHEAMAGANPFSTSQILSLTGRVDLSQHNYTAFLNLLALPVAPWLGVVATFNVVFLFVTALTAACTYALARRAFDTTRLEAFAAGLAFAWSPVLVARSTGHFSLVAAAPLAAFMAALIRAEQTRSTRHAALAGLAMAWAAFCDAYYAVFCLLMACLYVASNVVTLARAERRRNGSHRFTARPHSRPWTWLLDLPIVTLSGLVLGLALGMGTRVDVAGLAISVRGLYTPVMALTMLVLIRVAIVLRPRLIGIDSAKTWMKPVLVGLLACAGPLSPVLYGLGQQVWDGRFVNPPIFWRSSPRGVDLLAFVHPNPNHQVSRWILGDGQSAAPTVFVEYTAALSLVAVAVIVFAAWRAGFRPARSWWWVTIGFACLALGPFVMVAGTTTYMPGPWALLRYAPLIGAARTPTRFSVVVALGVAVLIAGALGAIGRRWPHRRQLASLVVLALLVVELMPAPRTLYSADISPLYDLVAADPRPVRLLALPFGVRDGVSSAGDFSARDLFNQTRHEKALIGGYLSRISPRRLDAMLGDYPELEALIALSEGHSPDEAAMRAFIETGRTFIERAHVGYVVVDSTRATPTLTGLAVDAFDLEPIASDGHLTLFRPRAERGAAP
jgi:hypothetical protein